MKLYVVLSEDTDPLVGVYSTPLLAAKAMERVSFCIATECALDKLPDEPEPGEPDYNAPSAQETAERDYKREEETSMSQSLEALAIQASQLQQAANTLRRAVEKHLVPWAHLDAVAHLRTVEWLAGSTKTTLELCDKWEREAAARKAATQADRASCCEPAKDGAA